MILTALGKKQENSRNGDIRRGQPDLLLTHCHLCIHKIHKIKLECNYLTPMSCIKIFQAQQIDNKALHNIKTT